MFFRREEASFLISSLIFSRPGLKDKEPKVIFGEATLCEAMKKLIVDEVILDEHLISTEPFYARRGSASIVKRELRAAL